MSGSGIREETSPSSEQARLDAQRQLEVVEALLGSAGLGVIATTAGAIVDISAKLAGLLGYQAAELRGQPGAAVLECDWLGDDDAAQSSTVTCAALMRDGARLPVQVRIARVRPYSATFIAAVSCCSEVPSTPPEPSESIVRLQKLQNLGALARGIAHDFNNLLLGILGNADLALLESPMASPSMGYLIDIKTTAEKAAELSQQLFAFSDDDPPELQSVPLNDLISGMHQLIDVATGQRGLLRLDLLPALPPVLAVPSQLQQVILSLAANAAEAVDPARGSIRISTRLAGPEHTSLSGMALPRASSYVLLEIEDNGRGIDNAAASHLFEPFFSTKGAGRGLGLFASRSIVQSHKGDLAVLPAAGQGTLVRIALPTTVPSKVPAIRPSRSAPGWRGNGTVLVVDDEHFVRTIVRQMLETIGFTVETAYDGQEAVNMVRRAPESIKLVLLDLTMPHMDGERAFREIRAMAPEVRVIVMSGYRARDVAIRFDASQPDGFIQKPFATQDVMEVIKSVLEP